MASKKGRFPGKWSSEPGFKGMAGEEERWLLMTGCSSPDNCHGWIISSVSPTIGLLKSVMLQNPVIRHHFPDALLPEHCNHYTFSMGLKTELCFLE